MKLTLERIGLQAVTTSRPTMGAIFLIVVVRAERVEYERERETVTPVERMLVAMVALAVVLFEIWFFFFSPSPI